MELAMLIENEVVEIDNESLDVHPTCPGCDRPLGYVGPEYPYCACGCLLFWPIPERI
jgi:hypothetical protein